MNNIKFRAWNVENKRMYYATPYRGYIKSNGSWWGLYNGDDVEVATSANDILMQYTGFEDKNRVEIYDGDILACDPMGYRDDIESTTRYVRHNGFGYVAQVQGDYGNYLIDAVKYGCEVIGNIHENPELLD